MEDSDLQNPSDALQRLPPPHEWALDPLCHAFRKVFIAQIHQGTETIPYSGHLLFYLRNKPLIKVHIVGCLVSIDTRPKKITYHVDDGTGVIRCVRYLNENGDFDLSPLEIGDLVMIKGSVEKYETNLEEYGFAIKVAIVEEVFDPNLESYHMAIAVKLFKDGL
eukprot:gene3613-2605_t